ncbi:unnamed protein product, partial [Didymodactylos carnosus]
TIIPLTALEWKILGNRHYSNHESSAAIQSYSEAIKLVQTIQQQDVDNVQLYLLYSNRSLAYIQVACMEKWRKSVVTAKKCINSLEYNIKHRVLMTEIPSILYQIRYLLRAHFENKKDKKLMNMNTGDLGLRLHELAVEFTAVFHV